ncbi:phage tail spike protein [Amphibacillus jilinensis]|uniref:phage tail spike protein n=1 Tax=Amphibacillus jilinensis TaxID=1216008 RepID=UPI0002E97CF2|nr:phage tail spike protein [Amphibacillus jilinensis]
MIHVLNGQTNVILDTIDQGSVLQNEHRRSLKDYLETFEITALADKKFAEYLTERNRMVIPAEEQGYTEFIIDEVVKKRGPNGLEVRVLALASYLELRKAAVVEPQTLTGYTPTTAVSFATNGTEWRPGRMDSNATMTFNIDSYTNPFAFLKRVANGFDLELSFRTETEGGRVVGRYVDLLERVGDWKGREITFGKDLEGIVRKEDVSQIYTALLCLGPENEDGERLETLVEDADALQRWGRPDPATGELKHLVDVFEPQSNQSEFSLEQLAQYGRTELNKRIQAFITYECDIIDLENVPDMHNKQIRFGDTIRIKDQKFSPPLYIEARVFEQRRDIFNKSNKHIELGDFIEFTEEEVTNIWRQLQAQIKARISFNELKEYTYNKEEIEQRDLTVYSNSKDYADTAVESVEIDDNNFRDDQPSTPQNVVAEGFFKVISVKWDYKSSSTIASYEVYASQTPGFTPAVSNIVWSGKAGSIMFEAETNEIWFFRVRAVNTRGTASGYSSEVSAETVRVQDIDVEMGAINAEKLADLAVTAEKLADGAVTEDKIEEESIVETKIKDDSISTPKLQSQAITSEKIAANSITAENGAIAELAVGNAAIQNSAITNAKIAEAAITEAKIDDLAVTDAKIASITADKIDAANLSAISANLGTITAGDITGVNITGSLFSSKDDSHPDYNKEMSLGDSRFSLSKGTKDDAVISYVEITSEKFSGINLSFELRGAGIDFYSEIGNHHRGAIRTGSDLYGQSFIELTSTQKTKVSGSIIEIFSTAINMSGAIDLNGNLVLQGGSYVYTNAIDHNGAGSHMYVRPMANGSVRITETGSTTSYRPIQASSFDTSSLSDYKTDIKHITLSALDTINQSDLCQYKLKSDVENGVYKNKYGLVIGEGYKTPEEVINYDGDAISQYDMNTLSWKAIQELSTLVMTQKKELSELKQKLEELK